MRTRRPRRPPLRRKRGASSSCWVRARETRDAPTPNLATAFGSSSPADRRPACSARRTGGRLHAVRLTHPPRLLPARTKSTAARADQLNTEGQPERARRVARGRKVAIALVSGGEPEQWRAIAPDLSKSFLPPSAMRTTRFNAERLVRVPRRGQAQSQHDSWAVSVTGLTAEATRGLLCRGVGDPLLAVCETSPGQGIRPVGSATRVLGCWSCPATGAQRDKLRDCQRPAGRGGITSHARAGRCRRSRLV
jgi:hypothetical protein